MRRLSILEFVYFCHNKNCEVIKILSNLMPTVKILEITRANTKNIQKKIILPLRKTQRNLKPTPF